ncbi:hypothetical protein IOK_06689 [Yersinia enterocolitica subsp. palearctica PhRBD_Ye1]|nr:hypothetical protein IOK_06689 [Yersinia enterocolitica subsp. palearctica PhRBD_Ye1]
METTPLGRSIIYIYSFIHRRFESRTGLKRSAVKCNNEATTTHV